MGILSKALLAVGVCATGAVVAKSCQVLRQAFSSGSFSSYNRHEKKVLRMVTSPEDNPVAWSDVTGEEKLAAELRKKVLNPLLLARQAQRLPPPTYRGVLLYGPSGCGKSLIAMAMAEELRASVINLHHPSVLKSARLMSAVVSVAERLSPCVVLIEGLEGQFGPVAEAVAQLLEVLAATEEVIVVAKAHQREDIEDSILRCFPLQFEVPLPDVRKRMQILESSLSDSSLCGDVDILALAKKTARLSCSDLIDVCEYAVWCSVREELPDQLLGEEDAAHFLAQSEERPLAWRHFEEAIEEIRQRKAQQRDSQPQMYV